MGSRTLIGSIVAIALGLGGAMAIEAAAGGMRTAPGLSDVLPVAGPARTVRVESITGALQARGVDGTWRHVTVATELTRPVALKTLGADSLGVVRFGSVRAALGYGAELWIGMPSTAANLHVESGQVVFDKDGPELVVHVPQHALMIKGSSFGVFVEDDRASVSVLQGNAQVSAAGGEATKYARLREVVLKGGRMAPSVMPSKLSLTTTGFSQRGRRNTLSGRTSAQAILLLRTNRGYERVAVAASGAFSAVIAGKEPAPGELVAFDSAGRRAEVGAPSGTADDEAKAILQGRGRQVADGEAEEEVKALKAPPAAVKEAPAAEAPPRAAARPKPKAYDAPPPVTRRAPPKAPKKASPPPRVRRKPKAPAKPKLAPPPEDDEEAL